MDAGQREVIVGPEHEGARLDTFLAGMLPERSRSQIQRLIKDGLVTGIPRRARALPSRPGSGCRSTCRRPAGRSAEPEAIPLQIRVRGRRRRSVVDKPAGMVVHPAAGHSGGTLVNALLHHVDDLSGIGGELRPGIVHRLDRGTSGTDGGGEERRRAPRAGAAVPRPRGRQGIHRARVGSRAGGPPHRRADRPRSRATGRRCRRARGGRASAVTRVTRAEHLKGVSLLHVAIATGRTHQIRVHLSAIGHPIVGDPTYGGVHRRVPGDLRAVQRLERPFLHASRLAFTHPRDGRRMEFESPLPPDLQRSSTTSASVRLRGDAPSHDPTPTGACRSDRRPQGRCGRVASWERVSGMSDTAERLSTERIFDRARCSRSTATASGSRTAASRRRMSSGIRDRSSSSRCRSRGGSCLIRQYRYAVERAGCGRCRRGASIRARRRNMPRRANATRRSAGCRRPWSGCRRALSDAGLLRRGDGLLPRFGARRTRRSRRSGRGRGYRGARRSTSGRRARWSGAARSWT